MVKAEDIIVVKKSDAIILLVFITHLLYERKIFFNPDFLLVYSEESFYYTNSPIIYYSTSSPIFTMNAANHTRS